MTEKQIIYFKIPVTSFDLFDVSRLKRSVSCVFLSGTLNKKNNPSHICALSILSIKTVPV